MGKEIELKYSIPHAECAEEILSSALVASELDGPVRIINMASVYYDTSDALLLKSKISLRRRQENDEVVYTVKTPQLSEAALSTRGEWQVSASDIDSALHALSAAGAPKKLFEITDGKKLIPCAKVSFVRKTAPLKFGAELCLDVGNFGSVPFAELELELAGGSLEALKEFGARCANEFSLKPETLSKFSRARAFFSSDI